MLKIDLEAFSEPSGKEIYHSLVSTYLLLDDGDRRRLKAYELTVPQFWTLYHLGDAKGKTMVELSKLLLCDKSNMTGVIDGLEKKELVQRIRGKERIPGKKGDRRKVTVVLTSLGQQKRHQACLDYDRHIMERMSLLSPGELQTLHVVLAKLKRGLKSQLEATDSTPGLATAIS